MGKDTCLANIYIKIHNKYALTLDDLKYLAKYDPECFEKACKNIVYKVPETKELMEPEEKKLPEPEEEIPPKAADPFEDPPADRERIEAVLANLKQMERKDLPVGDVRAEQVKELLGNLYMEMLFPHNDRMKYFSMEDNEELSVFNKKV